MTPDFKGDKPVNIFTAAGCLSPHQPQKIVFEAGGHIQYRNIVLIPILWS